MLMSPADRPASVFYQPNGFRVLTPGSHVTCAVSGAAIDLDDLRYWSVERQEAYVDARFALEAVFGK